MCVCVCVHVRVCCYLTLGGLLCCFAPRSSRRSPLASLLFLSPLASLLSPPAPRPSPLSPAVLLHCTLCSVFCALLCAVVNVVVRHTVTKELVSYKPHLLQRRSPIYEAADTGGAQSMTLIYAAAGSAGGIVLIFILAIVYSRRKKTRSPICC